MHSTNYQNTLISVSTDYQGQTSKTPKDGTIGHLQLNELIEKPYQLTSDELLFNIHAMRHNISQNDELARADFFARPLACLRCSPIVKTLGYGIHHDENSKIAAFAIDSDEYKNLFNDNNIKKVTGMRSKRA